jgi:hypothetical protein
LNHFTRPVNFIQILLFRTRADDPRYRPLASRDHFGFSTLALPQLAESCQAIFAGQKEDE